MIDRNRDVTCADIEGKLEEKDKFSLSIQLDIFFENEQGHKI